jgi:hypothetical protein
MKHLKTQAKLNEAYEGKITNYIISYIKDTTRLVDMSMGADNFDDLIKRLKKSLSESEFDSISKIEKGSMSFG